MSEEVLGRGVLVETANEVGDRRREVPALDNRRVEEQVAGEPSHGRSLRRSHALEHLDLDACGSSGFEQLLAQTEPPRNIEEVVAREADAHAVVEGGIQEDVEDRFVVGVDLVLGVVGRELPTVHLGLDVLHREVRALHHAHLDASPAASSSSVGPLTERAGDAASVGKVCLEHDTGVEVLQLRLVEQSLKRGDGQVEVAVLLHVEVDELRRVERSGDHIEGAQRVAHPCDRGVEAERADARSDR